MLRLAAIALTALLLAAPTVTVASDWIDQSGEKHESKQDRRKRPQRKVALRKNINDAVEFLAMDMMRRYSHREDVANLAVASFVNTRTRTRVQDSKDLERGLARELEKTDRFAAMDVDAGINIDAKLFEQMRGRFREDAFYYKKLGRSLGADVILAGTVSEGNNFVGVSARLVDVETERDLAVSQVYIPKDKFDAEPQDWEEYKAPKSPYQMVVRYRVRPPFDLAAYVEQKLGAGFEDEEYSAKGLDEEELYGEEFNDIPDDSVMEAPEEGEEEEMFVELDEGMDLDMDGEPDAAPEEDSWDEEESWDEEPMDDDEGMSDEEMMDEEMSEEEMAEEDTEEDDKKKRNKKTDVYEQDNSLETFECLEISIEDNIETYFRTNQDGYAFIFSIDERGQTKRLHPEDPRELWSRKVIKDRDYIFSDSIGEVPGCQRICFIVAEEPFKLNIDKNLLRRLACEEASIDLPWISSLPPNTTWQQRTLCVQQRNEPKLGEPTPSPEDLMLDGETEVGMR